MVTEVSEVKFPGEIAASAVLPENSAIDLRRVQKAFGVPAKDPALEKNFMQGGVDVAVVAEFFQYSQRLRQLHAVLVGPVLGGQKTIGDRPEWHLLKPMHWQ